MMVAMHAYGLLNIVHTRDHATHVIMPHTSWLGRGVIFIAIIQTLPLNYFMVVNWMCCLCFKHACKWKK